MLPSGRNSLSRKSWKLRSLGIPRHCILARCAHHANVLYDGRQSRCLWCVGQGKSQTHLTKETDLFFKKKKLGILYFKSPSGCSPIMMFKA